MIKRLQRKFVIIVAVCLLVVEVLIIGSINIVNIVSVNKDENSLLQVLAENDGKFPEFKPSSTDNGEAMPVDDTNGIASSVPDNNGTGNGNGNGNGALKDFHKNYNEETRYQTRYFTVVYNDKDKVSRVDTGHIAAVTSSQAVEYAQQAKDDGKEIGYAGIYKYKATAVSGGTMYIFLDCRKDSLTKNNFMLISTLIAAAGYVIVCLLVIIFSKRAVKPAIESFEKQRQFITDAGHEIKTPLAIISANTEVLEMTSEPNEWTESIKNQIVRLNGLLKNLLHLAKMEEENVKVTFCEFNVSDAVIDAAAPFETLAQTQGKTFETDIENNILFHGDEGAIRQLVSILTENAVKYCDDGGKIKVEMYKAANAKQFKLKVSNPCATPPQGDLSKLFDRFYRADESHSRDDKTKRKGGYGIGLSIAKAIVDSHKGKITCKAENGEICFTAVLKL